MCPQELFALMHGSLYITTTLCNGIKSWRCNITLVIRLAHFYKTTQGRAILCDQVFKLVENEARNSCVRTQFIWKIAKDALYESSDKNNRNFVKIMICNLKRRVQANYLFLTSCSSCYQKLQLPYRKLVFCNS